VPRTSPRSGVHGRVIRIGNAGRDGLQPAKVLFM
jgi:hypothetical protein